MAVSVTKEQNAPNPQGDPGQEIGRRRRGFVAQQNCFETVLFSKERIAKGREE
jgi:hypothetical protein